MQTAKLPLALASLLLLSACHGAEHPMAARSAPDASPLSLPQGLSDTRWRFVRYTSADEVPRVRKPGAQDLTLSFYADGTVSGQFACNAISAQWNEGPLRERATALYLTSVRFERMSCPVDGVAIFLVSQMKNVISYTAKDGEMHMEMMMNGGTLSFAPAE